MKSGLTKPGERPQLGTCQSSASSGFGHSGGILHELQNGCRIWKPAPESAETPRPFTRAPDPSLAKKFRQESAETKAGPPEEEVIVRYPNGLIAKSYTRDPAASVSPPHCPKCGKPVESSHGHSNYCPDPACKWGWEVEMDGSPLQPPIPAEMFAAVRSLNEVAERVTGASVSLEPPQTFSPQEEAAISELMRTMDISRQAVLRQGLRILQAVQAGVMKLTDTVSSNKLDNSQTVSAKPKPEWTVDAFVVFNSGFFQHMAATKLAAEAWARHFLADSPEVEIKEMKLAPAQSLSAKTPEQLAQRFHEVYERLAPNFGYKTREASAKPWAEVPENNRKLMTAVCAEMLEALRGT